MIHLHRLAAAACLTLGLLAAPASASTLGFFGAFWDSGSFATVDQAIAHAEANDPTATFRSTAIDYPRGAQNTLRHSRPGARVTLADYLADDAGSIAGNGGAHLKGSVFLFTGRILLSGSRSLFKVGSDDGFRLFIDGQMVSQQSRPRSFRATTVSVKKSGPVDFKLYYFENSGRTGVEFWVDNRIVDTSMAVVPLPAPGLLLLAGLAGMVTLRRQRRH